MDDNQLNELIRLMRENELALSALYETCAGLFPEHRDAWTAFAKEEQRHAKWVETLHTHLKNERITFDQVHFTIQSVRISIDYINRERIRVSTQPVDLKKALNIAVNMEKSLLENAFFKIFKLSNTSAAAIQTKLEEETKSHLHRLVDWHDSI